MGQGRFGQGSSLCGFVILVAALIGAGPAADAEDAVGVLLTGPLAAKVGERVTFEVELVNRSGRLLEKLRVIDYFDKGFHHEASASPIEQKGTVDLAAGTSRRLTLDFLLDEPGRQCHRVEILDQSHQFVGGATACVEVSPAAATAMAAPTATAVQPPTPVTPPGVEPAVTPPATASPPRVVLPTTVPPAGIPVPTTTAGEAALEIDLTGPAELAAGATGEYLVIIKNVGTATSTVTNLELSWDGSFTPLEASDGYKLGQEKASWSIPSVLPGGELRRQINLRPQAAPGTYLDSPGNRGCVRAVLSGLAGGVMVADEACATIRSLTPRPRSPRDAGLRLSIADLDDPVRIGGSTTIVCSIANEGVAASGSLELVIVLPDQARLVGDPRPSRVRIDGSNVVFDSIPSLPAGGRSTFELTYRMPGGGTGRSTAILTGGSLDGSVENACTTTFLAP